MVAIITCDIINSESHKTEVWLPLLEKFLSKYGKSPQDWEIYRGDEFQLRLANPEDALSVAFHLKAVIRSIEGLDVRIGMGIGNETYKDRQVSVSNGSAYQYSGRMLDLSRKIKQNLVIKTDVPSVDKALNLMFELSLVFMDNWSVISAQTLAYKYEYPEKSQLEMAEHFGVGQSNISQRLMRAQYSLLLKINDYFREQLLNL